MDSDCSELYIYDSYGDNTFLDCSQHPEEDPQPVIREEVDFAVAALKRGNKILKTSFKRTEHIQKKGTWAILRSFGYSSLISDPDIFW